MMDIKNIVKSTLKKLVQFLYNRSYLFKRLNDFRYSYGRFPNLINPTTFNEGLLIKILFDRNPRLTLFADKYKVREYVEGKCGKEILTKIYSVVTDTQEIRKLDLPSRFVMKANHLSGEVKIIRTASEFNREELIDLADTWLKKNYYDSFREWAYKNIEPVILFEEFLDNNGAVPDDYKFFCFHGVPIFLQIDKARFTGHVRNMYDIDFNLLPLHYNFPNFSEVVARPINFDKMIEISKKLSKGVDFLRVDLYNINGRIVFGELTNYPGAGSERFNPESWDKEFGKYWNKDNRLS